MKEPHELETLARASALLLDGFARGIDITREDVVAALATLDHAASVYTDAGPLPAWPFADARGLATISPRAMAELLVNKADTPADLERWSLGLRKWARIFATGGAR